MADQRECMNFQISNTTDNYVSLIKHGVLANNTIEHNLQSNLFLEWFINCSDLPNSCHVEIYLSKNRKKERLKENHEPKYQMGILFLLEEPIYSFFFDKQGIIFEPLTHYSHLTFKEWVEIYMYDLRVQKSISHILYILRENQDITI